MTSNIIFSRAICVIAIVIPIAMMGTASPAGAAVTFAFNYTDPAGMGFNAAGAVGMQRRDALELAGQNFATAFSSYTANIVIGADGTSTGSTLAAAGSEAGPFVAGFGGNEVIRNKVLNGTDLNGSGADGTVSANFATVNWELDINAPVSATEFDWYSTMYHEFAHAFGFLSGVVVDASGQNANDGYGTTGANDGSWGAFDQLLTNGSSSSVFSSFDLDEPTYEALLIGGNSASGDGLFYNSPDAAALIGLYSPNAYEGGSSGSHLDDQNPALAGLMMLAATGEGSSARTFAGLEQSIFRDIGYMNVGQIVPEPSTTVLMLLAACTAMVRRRRTFAR